MLLCSLPPLMKGKEKEKKLKTTENESFGIADSMMIKKTGQAP